MRIDKDGELDPWGGRGLKILEEFGWSVGVLQAINWRRLWRESVVFYEQYENPELLKEEK